MRVLAITYVTRVPNNDRLYESLAQYVDLQCMKIDRSQAKSLAKTLEAIDLLQFDRVVVELRAKHVISQWRTLWKIPNLVLFEEDTWQNYVEFSKNYGFFVEFFHAAQPSRILHSGWTVSRKTRRLGFDSHFLPKGFDGGALKNLQIERDIEMGFVGRMTHSNYVHRKRFLLDLAETEPLQLLRTESSNEYLNTLNRIKFFISADIEFGEHMIKNFEAMACGCVLFAYRQGEDDGELGLQDMVNVVLYDDKKELLEKLEKLRNDPDLVEQIAQRGQILAAQNHDHWVLGKRYYELLNRPLAAAPRRMWQKAVKSANKIMRAEFFAEHFADAIEEEIAPESDAISNIAERNLRFIFFKDGFVSRWLGRDQQARYLANYYLLSESDVNLPVLLYWGIQPESSLHFVAIESEGLEHSPINLSHFNETTYQQKLLTLVNKIHQSGFTFLSLSINDLALNSRGELLWLACHKLISHKSPLSAEELRRNIAELAGQSTNISSQVEAFDLLGVYNNSANQLP